MWKFVPCHTALGENEMTDSKDMKCVWTERSPSSEYYYPSCIGTPINIFKTSKKRGLPVTGLFRTCIYCGKKVEFKFCGEKKDER